MTLYLDSSALVKLYTIPDLDLVHVAGELADRHGLRGFDAVHLASALKVQELKGTVTFAAFDRALVRAAKAEGRSLGI